MSMKLSSILECLFTLTLFTGINAKKCKDEILITNLDANATVSSSVEVGDDIFQLDVSTNKGYPLTMVTVTSDFELTGKDDRDVTVSSCLAAGVTHDLMIESDSDKSCAADTGILSVIVEGTTPVFSDPGSDETVDVVSADVTADQVTVYDITITNIGSCTTFTCDVTCTSSAHVFAIAGGSTTITTTVSELTYNSAYALDIACYDTNAQSDTSVTQSFNVIFTTSLTFSTTSTTTTTSTTSTTTTPTTSTTTPKTSTLSTTSTTPSTSTTTPTPTTTSTTTTATSTTSTTTPPTTSTTSTTPTTSTATTTTSTTTTTTPSTTSTSTTTTPTTSTSTATSTTSTTTTVTSLLTSTTPTIMIASTNPSAVGSAASQQGDDDGFFDDTTNVIAISTIGGLALAGIGVAATMLIYRMATRASRITPGAGRRRILEDEDDKKQSRKPTKDREPTRDRKPAGERRTPGDRSQTGDRRSVGDRRSPGDRMSDGDRRSAGDRSPSLGGNSSPTSISSRASLLSRSSPRSPVSLVDLSLSDQTPPPGYFHWNDF